MQLSADEMRRLGYRVVDAIVQHIMDLPDSPVQRVAGRRDLEERLHSVMPEFGVSPEQVLDDVIRNVLPLVGQHDHPRFFAFVPGPSNYVSVMADTLAAGYNVFAGTWTGASGPAEIELVVVEWLRALCGMPDTAAGLCVGSGSVANLTALTVARHVKLRDDPTRGTAYFSDQTHSSVERGLATLGFSPHHMRRLEADAEGRLSLPDLDAAVRRDAVDGLKPFCVIANAGTTNTGAVDSLAELARLCAELNMWLHVDGAYGAPAIMTERGQAILRGIELVDSLSLDPHKWLFQPYEIGCVLVRRGDLLRETFLVEADYLGDVHEGPLYEVNFSDYGLQLTRSFRALKVWMSMKTFGASAFREAIERGFELAERAEARLRRSGLWEITSPAQMGILTFRLRVPDVSHDRQERAQHVLVDDVRHDGYALISSTRLSGKTVARMCTINPRTTEADIDGTIDRLEMLAHAVLLRIRTCD